MNSRTACLYLLLVLVTAWTDNLQAGPFAALSPMGNPSFGEEVYPIAARFRAEIQEELESLPPAPPNSLAADSPWDAPGAVLTPPNVPPQILSSAERRHLLVSVQE